MPIDGINTAMTPTQFGRARSAVRTVETTEASVRRKAMAGNSSPSPQTANPAIAARQIPTTLTPARLHFTYRPIPGKPAAKRHPQVADTAYWSLALNRLG